MARLHGRSPRGERCRAAIPHGHWKTTTFTVGLRSDGLIAPLVLDGPMDGDAFLAYVEQLLTPSLRPGDTVIMDMCGRPRWCKKNLSPRGSLQIPPGVVSQIPPPARQDKGLLV
ncbi:hypothetical protein EI171_41040 [Bradyrhizobium sp. LCT2]|nr:hypothetical protein EI171_41040 [Bradyrhizobium sp. LCT2]